MKQVIEKYFCDNCEDEMDGFEYRQCTKLSIRVDLPHPEGRCGQVEGEQMVICSKCSEELGIVNSKEYHSYNYSKEKFKNTIREIKTKIVAMYFKKRGAR